MAGHIRRGCIHNIRRETALERESRLNSITHLFGAAAALAGAAVLVVFASEEGDPWKIVTSGVYGVTLFVLYLTSTLYHSLKGKQKALFRTLDHIAIYLLIAGTYTPISLVTLRGAWGWSIFGAVWTLALLGIVWDSIAPQGRRTVPMVIYLTMGWGIIIALKPLIAALSVAGFAWLLAGGLFYTGGILFFIRGERRSYYHGIWHLFVLAGSISHYMMVFFYIL
jgi:hemolysin III